MRVGSLGRCGAFPVQLDFGVVRGAQHSDHHTNTVERRDGDGEEDNAEENSKALLQVAADGDSKGASDLVSLERDNVERERHQAVADNGEQEGPVEDALRYGDLEAAELATGVGVEETLECGKRRHAEEHFHSGECKGSGHKAVGRDRLNGCENDAEEGEEETHHCEVVVAKGSESNTKDERDHRNVGVARVGASVNNAVDDDGRNRAGRSQDLVEGY